MAKVYMAMDPETRRVLVQTREFSDGDFPRGVRGAGWPRRVGDVQKRLLDKLLAGKLTSEAQDALHRDWWDRARPEGAPLWPQMPDEV